MKKVQTNRTTAPVCRLFFWKFRNSEVQTNRTTSNTIGLFLWKFRNEGQSCRISLNKVASSTSQEKRTYQRKTILYRYVIKIICKYLIWELQQISGHILETRGFKVIGEWQLRLYTGEGWGPGCWFWAQSRTHFILRIYNFAPDIANTVRLRWFSCFEKD